MKSRIPPSLRLLIGCAFLTSSALEAQQPVKLPRIGFLDPTSIAVSKARIVLARADKVIR